MAAQPNKIAYITGASAGIGQALSEKLIREGFHVIGMARTKMTAKDQFTPVQIDLSNLEQVKRFDFDRQADEVLLVNNAGTIGEILPVGKLSEQTITQVMTVNSIAPQLLMNKFIGTYLGNVQHGHIVNISSGAGKRPIDAWANYCASKAALDLFSETIRSEWEARSIKSWFIHSIAPGVVDTNMQTDIRAANPDEFKVIERFKSLKANNELSEPVAVAEKLFQVIAQPSMFEKTVISVRDF